ncbi:transcriptional regulator [Campylobacterota bacterium]|nr:transcriptional regulator [Campylobacterota bacterium]
MGTTIAKPEFVARFAEKSGFTKGDSEKAINALLETITDALIGDDDIRFVGFGAFGLRERAAYIGRHPITQQQIKIPAKKTVVFRAGKNLNDAVNK